MRRSAKIETENQPLLFPHLISDGAFMPNIELRVKADVRSPEDLIVTVQQKTFEYLQVTITPEIRISAYLDHACPRVEAKYEEVFVDENCRYRSKITGMIPGSKTRKGIVLPGPMEEGEQLTIVVQRTEKK